jgi:hypothetical protein
MNSDENRPKTNITPARADARAERERRLAEALRENLKRRKHQSRGRADATRVPPSGGDADK